MAQRAALGRGLQSLFQQRLKVQDKFNETLEILKEARKIIEETKAEGYDVKEAQRLFNQAEPPLREKNYDVAIQYAKQAKESAILARDNEFKATEEDEAAELDLKIDTQRADDAINRTQKIMDLLRERNIDIEHIQLLLAQAQEFFEAGEYEEMEGCALEAEAYAEFVKKIEENR